MDAKEFHAAARRIEGLQRKLCETEVERDAWKRSYQDLSKSAHRELTEVRVTARQEIERTREEQRNVWHEQLGARDDESLSDAIKRVLEGSDALRTEVETWHTLNVQWREMLGALPQESLTEAINRVVMTKAERDKQSALIDEQRRLLAAKQTEIGALEAERDEMKEEIKQANKEASDATARQRMTEARALKYSAQAEDARREIERLRSEVESLRAKFNAKTVEWPEWAKVGARVRVRSNDCMTTQNSDRVVGEELVIYKVDRRDWTIQAESFGWAHVSDLEPVAEHTQPAVAVQS